MKVIVSAPLPGPAVDAMRAEHEVIVGESPYGLGRDGFLSMGRDHADTAAIVPLVSDRVDADLVAAFPALRVIANYGVGVDNIDRAAAKSRGVIVCNTPDVLTEATADLTWALLLATARRVVEGERMLRNGGWKGWSPTQLLGPQVSGATIGIVGFGRIGRAVFERARGFGMSVLAVSTGVQHVTAPSLEMVSLSDLLERSDFVSLHCPLTETTRNLIDADALARMKPTAVFVNTARGAIVDEAALARALHDRVIAGAGLDVYVHEPDIHPDLLTAPNTVLLPHLGSASVRAREAMALLACEGARDVLAGRPPRHRVV